MAEERGIELSLTFKGQVLGDRLMLDRALSNLLSNALRYTPAGQTISVLIRETEDSTTFSINFFHCLNYIKFFRFNFMIYIININI